jgi:hypothetical protein
MLEFELGSKICTLITEKWSYMLQHVAGDNGYNKTVVLNEGTTNVLL